MPTNTTGMSTQEQANVKVTLNNEEAKRELDQLNDRIRKLIELKKKAEAEGDVKGFKKIEAELKKANREAKKYEKQMYDIDAALKNINGASWNELKRAEAALVQQTKGLNRETKEFISKSAQLKLVRNEIASINAQQRASTDMWGRMSTSGSNFVSGIMGKLVGITAGIASFGVLATKMTEAKEAADNFEERLDNLSALTGLEGTQLDELGNIAKQTSVKITDGNVRIKQSADDIVDAYTKVGSQRPELLKNGESLASVTEDAIILSEAAKSALEPAVAGLTTTMNQFNLGATESRRIINAMAAGSKEGAADIPYLTQAIEKSGTTLSLMNIPLETNIGLIEAVAPKYAKAEMAGNSLDKVFLKLKEKQIGYVNGTFNLNAALDELAKRYATGETATQIFGSEHAKMGEILVQNRADIERYTNAVTGTNIAIEQAAKNTNNAKAIQAQARNEYHLAAIELGKNLSPAMTSLYQLGAKVARSFSNMISESPVESLRRQQTEINGLVVELKSANIEEARREEILKRLKDVAPDLAKAILNEKTNIEDLTNAVAEYNKEMSLKILIAEGDTSIAEQSAKVNSLQKLAAKSEANLAVSLKKSIDWFAKKAPAVKTTAEEILYDTNKSIQQKAEELNKLALDNTLLGNSSLFGALDSYRIFRKNYTDELFSLDLLIAKTDNKKQEWQRIFGTDLNTESQKNPIEKRNESISNSEIKTTTDNSASITKSDKNQEQTKSNKIGVDDKVGLDLDIQSLQDDYDVRKMMEADWTSFLENESEKQANVLAQKFQVEQEIAAAREDLKDAQIQGIGQIAGALSGMFEQGSAMQVAMFAFEKAMAIATIWVNLAKEKSAIAVAAAEMATIPIIGPGMAAAYSSTMTAKAMLNAKINTAIVAAQAIAQVAQHKDGLYPVVGATDGKTYNTNYAGRPKTGIYRGPQLGLFNEDPSNPELVVDGKTTTALRVDYPQVYRGIQQLAAGYAPQFADGKYPEAPNLPQPFTTDPELKALLKALNIQLAKGIKAKVNKYDEGGLAEAIDDITNFNSKISHK